MDLRDMIVIYAMPFALFISLFVFSGMFASFAIFRNMPNPILCSGICISTLLAYAISLSILYWYLPRIQLKRKEQIIGPEEEKIKVYIEWIDEEDVEKWRHELRKEIAEELVRKVRGYNK